MMQTPSQSDVRDATTMFFVVGAGKAGTTWLHDYLSGHPQVSCGPTKEYSYHSYFWKLRGEGPKPLLPLQRVLAQASLARRTGLAKGYLGSAIYALRKGVDYKALLRGDDPEVKAFGDVSPRYTTLGADAFAAMRQMHPKSKFIFLMREPVDRLWSSVQMRVRDRAAQGRETDGAYMEARIRDALVFESMNYPRALEALAEAVPTEDLEVFFYETMFCQSEMDRLCDALGVEHHAAAFERKVFAGAKDEMPGEWARAMYFKLKHMYEFVQERCPGQVPDYWLQRAAEYEKVA